MKLNQIKKIDNTKGPWLLVVDYGYDGLSVVGQFESAQDAVDEVMGGNWSGPCAVLYLPNIHCQAHLPAEATA
jgi:hypothetical protein